MNSISDLQLSDIANPDVLTVTADTPLATVVRLFAEKRVSAIVVVEHTKPIGIITERDVPRLMLSHDAPETIPVSAVMSSPLRSIGIDVSVAEAARIMDESPTRHLVLVDEDGRVAGTLSQHRMLERLSTVLMEEGHAWLTTQLDLVQETTGVGTWEFDHSSRTLSSTPALSHLLGLKKPAGPGPLADLLARLDPEDQPRIEQAFTSVRPRTEAGFSQDCRVRGLNDRVRWLSLRGRVVERDASGQPLRSAGVAIDIDALKLAQARSSRSESHLLRLMQYAPIPLCHVNGDAQIIYTNHQFLQTFGYRREDIPDLATWWAKAYPVSEYRELVMANWQQAVDEAARTDGVIRPGDYRVTCANGDIRLVEIAGITLGDELLTTFSDVTQQRMQQHLLEFGNAILRQVSTASPRETIFEFICREIEHQIGGLHCAIMLLDPDTRCLHSAAAPSLPQAYSAALQGLAIGPAVGSCGTAAFRGEPVLVTDIASDPLWQDFRELALEHGLAACWSSPIKSPDAQVLGTFALYWRQPQAEVSALVRAYVEAATSLAAIAIASERREATLHDQLGELRRWQQVMLGREGRVLELKQEVNTLLARMGDSPRYASVLPGNERP